MRARGVAVPVLASSLGFLDTGATVVVLPQTAQELGLTIGQQQQVLGLSLLAVGLLVIPAGALGDAWGQSRTGRVGLAVAAAGSMTVAVASAPALLAAGRVAFGIGASLFLPSALASMTALPDAARRLRQWTVATTAVALVAPAIGAAALAASGWRSLYAAEAVLAVALALTWRPSATAPSRSLTGRNRALLALSSAALAAFVVLRPPIGVIVGVLLVAGALVLLRAMLRGRTGPMAFGGVQLVTVAAYAAFTCVPFLLSLYLQGAQRLSSIAVAALLCLDGLLVVLLTPLIGRTGHGVQAGLRRVAAGATVCAAGAAALALLVVERPVAGSLVGLVLVGVGSALFIAPLTEAALSVVDRRDAGLAAGISLAVARLAAAAGLAAAGALAAWAAMDAAGADAGSVRARPLSPPPGEGPLLDAAAAGFRLAMALAALLFLIAAAVAVATALLARLSGTDDGPTSGTAAASTR